MIMLFDIIARRGGDYLPPVPSLPRRFMWPWRHSSATLATSWREMDSMKAEKMKGNGISTWFIHYRRIVCRRKSRRHHWHSRSSQAGWKLKCFHVATTRQRSLIIFIIILRETNSATELNWQTPWTMYTIANNYRRHWRGYSASTDKRLQLQTSSCNAHFHRS